MKLFTEELALELTKKLLQNDKDIRDDLQAKINDGTSGEIDSVIEEKIDEVIRGKFDTASSEDIINLF